MQVINIEFYVLKIRRLAAKHQQGTGIVEIKKEVDVVFKEMKQKHRKSEHIYLWSELIPALNNYLAKTATPEWHSVLRYAITVCKRRLNTSKRSIPIFLGRIVK